jgi:hypothetical protein
MTRNARRAACGHVPIRGAEGHPHRTQLYLQWLLRLPTAPGLLLKGDGDFGMSAFLGSSRTSRCLLVPDDMGCRAQSAMGWRKLSPEHLLRVAQFANWSGGTSPEALRVQSSRLGHLGGGGPGASRGRAGVSTADLANWCDRPNMRRDRSISAIHGAGNKEIRVCSSLRLHGDAHHVASMRLPGPKDLIRRS